MPPSNYFQATGKLNDASNDDSNDTLYMAESESLLEYAEENTLAQTYLSFHYRSKHPFLIDFSNAAFYGNRLLPIPSLKDYKPIRLFRADGIYSEGTNPIEAEKVVDIIANEINADKGGNFPSVGVATTNISQRNLIWEKLRERSFIDKDFAVKFALLTSNKFFVKNLENL